ncbi:MAG: N-acetylmuramoyl-L-alanine amidase-like domain-containing protein [Bacteroidota bacterium]
MAFKTISERFIKSLSVPEYRTIIAGILFLICTQALHSIGVQENSAFKNKAWNHNVQKPCIYAPEDSAIFAELIEKALEFNWYSLGKSDVIEKVATHFLGFPYKAGTLEHDGKETLIINLREFDCTTFIEHVMALSLNIMNKEVTFEDYCQQLKKIRYRGGIIDGYPSRLHYFSDWLHDNEKKDLIKIIHIPGHSVILEKQINFMSTHPGNYNKLGNADFLKEIKTQEEEIIQRTFTYIPQEKISVATSEIRSGDLIAITTNIAGLDIMHTGLSIRINNQMHLIHASSRSNKVIISGDNLHDEVNKNKLMSGIMVARIK